jgi:hypothetical protein
VHLTLAPSSTFGDHHSAPCSSSGSETIELLSSLSRVGVVFGSSFASSLSAPSTFSTEAYSLGESWLADESVLTSVTTLTSVARLVSAGPDTSPSIICMLPLEICCFAYTDTHTYIRTHVYTQTQAAEDWSAENLASLACAQAQTRYKPHKRRAHVHARCTLVPHTRACLTSHVLICEKARLPTADLAPH